MTGYVYKLKNGKLISVYADEKGNISITKETLEIMVNSWNDGYQQGREDAIDECINTIIDYCGGLPNGMYVNALEQLKEQKNG